jgi:hypothetical protein
MNVYAEKIALIKLILNTEIPEVLKKIKEFFVKENDFWNSISQAEKEDILKVIQEIERGDSYPYEALITQKRNN